MKSIAAKLLAFQKEVGTVSKDAVNPFFHSKYADINSYIEVVKPILSKHGLVILQPLAVQDGRNVLKTIVLDPDADEQLIESVILPENSDPQKMGAIITYFRRYALQSLFSLQAEDTDGNDTNTVQPPKASPSPVQKRIEPSVLSPEDEVAMERAFGGDEPAPQPKYHEKVVGAVCTECNSGRYVKSPSTGKIFCSEKCWLRKAP